MSEGKITVDDKEYNLDCLSEDQQDSVVILNEIRNELGKLTLRMKVLQAADSKMSQDLINALAESSSKQIKEPQKASSGAFFLSEE